MIMTSIFLLHFLAMIGSYTVILFILAITNGYETAEDFTSRDHQIMVGTSVLFVICLDLVIFMNYSGGLQWI